MRRVAAILLVSSACARPQVELPPGEAFVVATRDALGARALRWWQSGVDVLFEAPEAGELAVAGPFDTPLPRAPSWGLVDPLGGGAGLSFEGEPPPPGSCGACQLASIGAVTLGDRCPLPDALARSAYAIEGGAIEPSQAALALLDEVRVDWPGACEHPVSFPPATGLEIRYLDGGAPLRDVAAAEDGTVAVVSVNRAIIFGPNGERREFERRGDPQVLWIPGTSPARFVIPGPERTLDEYALALAEPRRLENDVGFWRFAAGLDGGAWIVFGRSRGAFESKTVAFRCQIEPWRCAIEELPSCVGDAIRAGERFDGELWAITEGYDTAIRGTDGRWRCGPKLIESRRTPEQILIDVVRLSPDELLLCSSDGLDTRLQRVTLDPVTRSPALLATRDHERPVSCVGRVETAEGARVLSTWSSHGIDPRTLELVEPVTLDLGRPIFRVVATRTATAILTWDDAIFRERAGSRERLEGSATPRPRLEKAVGTRGTELIAIDDAGTIARFSSEGEPLGSTPLTGLAPGELVRRLAETAEGHWAVTEREGTTSIRRVSAGGAAGEAHPFPFDELEAIADAGAGFVYVLAASKLSLWSEAGGRVELSPRPVGALSAVDGVAWATGPDVVLRAAVIGGAPRVEAIELSAYRPDVSGRVELAAPIGLAVFARSAGRARVTMLEAYETLSERSHELVALELEADGAWRGRRSSIDTGQRARAIQRHHATEKLLVGDDGLSWVEERGVGLIDGIHRQAATLRGEPWTKLLLADEFGALLLVQPKP